MKGGLAAFLARFVGPVIRHRPWVVYGESRDMMNVVILLIFGVCTRFPKLYNREVPFAEEVSFANAVKVYFGYGNCTDGDPPLGKLLAALYLSGLGRDVDREASATSCMSLRLFTSVVSAVLPALWYLVVLTASFSRIAAFVAGGLIVFDSAFVSVGRLAMVDAFAHLFVVLTMLVVIFWFSLPRGSGQWRIWMYATSFALGCATCVHRSARCVWLIVGAHELLSLVSDEGCKLSVRWLRGVFHRTMEMAVPAVIARAVIFMIHFTLTHNGSTNVMAFSTFLDITAPMMEATTKDAVTNAGLRPDRTMRSIYVFCITLVGVGLTIIAYDNRKYFTAFSFVIGFVASCYGCDITGDCCYSVSIMFGTACVGIALDFSVGPMLRGFLAPILVGIAAFGLFNLTPFIYEGLERPMRATTFQDSIYSFIITVKKLLENSSSKK